RLDETGHVQGAVALHVPANDVAGIEIHRRIGAVVLDARPHGAGVGRADVRRVEETAVRHLAALPEVGERPENHAGRRVTGTRDAERRGGGAVAVVDGADV